MEDKIKEIASNFKFIGNLKSISVINQGNINSSYILVYKDQNKENKYLLQKINSYVFKDPYIVMKNIELVTSHIKNKLQENNDNNYNTLNIIKTKDNSNIFVYINSDLEKEYYRAYDYVTDSITYDNFKECENPNQVAYNTGKCFGNFHKLLSDAPINMLNDTIKDFHNTPKRFDDLIESIKNNTTNRAINYAKEIISLTSRIKECSIIWNNLGKTLPMRVTHNDTKLNNVLFDKDTKEAKVVIDLDTVMPGSFLFDVGDGIRSTCSNSLEDETDLSKIYLNLDLTKNYLKGYLEEMVNNLTKEEVNLMGLSIKIITYELTLRFLTDYLNGDTYFKIKYKEHNKDRFINQYTLLLDIEKKQNEINDFIIKTYNDLKKN